MPGQRDGAVPVSRVGRPTDVNPTPVSGDSAESRGPRSSVERMTTNPNATPDDLATIQKIIAAAKIANLTTISSEGHLVSRPLAVQGTDDFDGTVWFFTQHPTDKTLEIERNNHVNASFSSGKGYLSIAGTASIVHDEAAIERLWNAEAGAWFPDGRDDTVALIKLDADTAEYWSTDDPKPIVLFKVAKAALTGGQPDIGDNKTVVL